MRQNETKERLKNMFESFVEQPDSQNNSITHPNKNELTQTASDDHLVLNQSLMDLLKQIFFFFPGTLMLLFVGIVGAIILIDIFVVQRPLETLPESAPLQILLLGIVALLGTFMTWFGLGDIKNKRHFSIPASILAAGGLIAVIFKALEVIFDFARLLEEFNHYFIYFLPLALIVPILVKGWVDRKAED